MVEIKMPSCTRCAESGRDLFLLFVARPGGHSLPSLSPPPAEYIVPQTEHVCLDCLTDDEISRELSGVTEFVLSNLIERCKDSSFPGTMVSLETARAFFTVRNNGTNNRKLAEAALKGIRDA